MHGAEARADNVFANIQKLSPRVRLAARLYATGACKTKREASAAAGLHPSYLTLLKDNPRVNEFINQIDAAIADEAVDMSKLLIKLGRKAVRNVAAIMESDQIKDEVRLKAAQDLADRSPETSKIQKHQIESEMHATPEVAAMLASAMVEAARNRMNYQAAAEGDFVTVDMTKEVKALPESVDSGQQGR